MEHVRWTEDMSIGDAEIDRQHKELFALLDKTFEAAGRRESDAASQTTDALRSLCDYVVKHFASEEALMDPATYPEYDRHVQEHIEGSMRALDFLDAANEGRDVRVEEFLEFLVEWVRHHIHETDQTLGRHLARKRAAGA